MALEAGYTIGVTFAVITTTTTTTTTTTKNSVVINDLKF